MAVALDARRTALVLVDLQNDYIHPQGAYARAGVLTPEAAALPARLRPVAEAVRAAGGWIVSTNFTLVPGRDGEPMVPAYLRKIRPFLAKGDFLPGAFGHDLVEELKPAHIAVEAVAFSAFYMSRLEFALRKARIETLAFAGVTTNAGVASTLRDAHMREYDVVLLSDGCAAFSREAHEASLATLRTIAHSMTCDEFRVAIASA